MGNINLSDENKEVLKSGAFKELGDAMRAEIVKEYLRGGYASGDKQHDIEVSGITYKVLDRGEVTAFYDALGNTLFSVENEKLAAEYAEMTSGDNAGSAEKVENGGGTPEGDNPDPADGQGNTVDIAGEESAVPSETEESEAVTAEEAEEKQEDNTAPAKCITGKSKSGVCGAAAYCDKGLECCSACWDPCNSRCGWLDVQEESANNEASAAPEMAEDFKEKACEKLRGEKEKAKDKQFADPVIGYLLERCVEDNGLAQDVMQEHKTWEKCFKYIFEQARKQAKGNSAAVRDDVVYEWAEDYYHKDDKAEEEKKVREAAERKKKEVERKKKAAEKKPLASQEAGTCVKKEKAADKPAEPKPKKNSKDMDGQMDLFSMMGV